MRFDGFPRSTPTPLRVSFLRHIDGEAPTDSESQALVFRRPNRFPRDSIITCYDSLETNNPPKRTSQPLYTNEDSKGLLNFEPTDGKMSEWSSDDVELWLESEYPIHLPWSHGVVAVLPDVQIPQLFWDRSDTLFAAVNEHAELGFVDLKKQECWERVPFDHVTTASFKHVAEDAGWNVMVWNEPVGDVWDAKDEKRRNSFANQHTWAGTGNPEGYMPGRGHRDDDGRFDQTTHAFFPGRRCGWCGSSCIRPSFIGEPQCIACHSKDDAIESRDNMNLTDLE